MKVEEIQRLIERKRKVWKTPKTPFITGLCSWVRSWNKKWDKCYRLLDIYPQSVIKHCSLLTTESGITEKRALMTIRRKKEVYVVSDPIITQLIIHVDAIPSKRIRNKSLSPVIEAITMMNYLTNKLLPQKTE